MKKNRILKIICAAIVTLPGFIALPILADTTENPPVQYGIGTNSIFGKYYAQAKMTNGVGSYTIKPDTNIVVSSGTLTDISGFSAPYSSYTWVSVLGKTNVYCGSNNVTFPATNTLTYMISVFVTSPTPPPTNGEPMTIQLHWQ